MKNVILEMQRYQRSVESAKNILSKTIFDEDMLHSTVYNPTELQTDTWNPWKNLNGIVVPQTCTKPIMENFKVLWNVWKLAEHGHFK